MRFSLFGREQPKSTSRFVLCLWDTIKCPGFVQCLNSSEYIHPISNRFTQGVLCQMMSFNLKIFWIWHSSWAISRQMLTCRVVPDIPCGNHPQKKRTRKNIFWHWVYYCLCRSLLNNFFFLNGIFYNFHSRQTQNTIYILYIPFSRDCSLIPRQLQW